MPAAEYFLKTLDEVNTGSDNVLVLSDNKLLP